MPKTFQVKNPKTGAFVKMRKKSSGKTKILDVKQKNPGKKFKGVPVKKR